jgi:CO/xanthine dehydrogenase Mo-binding subunit
MNARGDTGKGSYKVIGTRPVRHDGLEKVTGQARFGADISLPGMLHGKILRSPYAHARIKSIDTSGALTLPGVKAVVISADLPQLSGRQADVREGAHLNPRFLSNNILAADKVLYKGHAVAAVAADSPHTAEEALSRIRVDYEPLPTVLDGKKAMEPGAPILHQRLYRSEGEFFRPGGLRDEGAEGQESNVASHFVFQIGEPEEGFAAADVVVEREFHTATVHQGYIEPHTATAMWNRDGKITIWDSSQGQFATQELTALVLNFPVSQIKVVPMEIGGGFGGKIHIFIEPVAALLSKKTGRPVRVTLSRGEEFEGTGPASGAYVKAKIGATRNGRITAAQAELVYEAGAYPGAPVNLGTLFIFGPYDIPNVRVEGYDVVVNKPKASPYRAPGGAVAGFAGETLMDELCDALSLDPLDFRLLNGAREGTRRVTGLSFRRIGYLETVQAAKDHPHYRAPLGGPNRGRGVATGVGFNISGPACALLNLKLDGTVSLTEGSPDLAGSRTAMAMLVAEVLGIPAEDVHPFVGDTDAIGYTAYTAGSSVTYKTGWACHEAAQDMKRQLLQRAARIWDVPPEDVGMAGGAFFHKSDPELRLTIKELAAASNTTGGPVVGRAAGDWGGESPTAAVHIVDVEVDPETGKTRLRRYTALQDPGTAVHPGHVEGQMQGGAVQGIGWALNEAYFFDDQGRMLNSTFLDYRMPTSADLPMIDAELVQVPSPDHPAGVRGVGEVSIIPPTAAIANAVRRAVGVRMIELPMSPATVLEALWRKKAGP